MLTYVYIYTVQVRSL